MKYDCARCGRKLTAERSIRSHFTGSRFCWPGEHLKRKKKAMA